MSKHLKHRATRARLSPAVTIPAAFVEGLLSGVRSRGHVPDTLLVKSGIAPELLRQPNARVTAAQYLSLFRLLVEHTSDEALGLLSRPLKRGSFALIVRSSIGTPTLDVALRRIAHTFALLQDDVVLKPTREGPLAGMALSFVEPEIARATFLHEYLLRVFWRLAAWLAGGSLPAARFDFGFPTPVHAAAYEQAFPASCRFDRHRSAFWFDASLQKRAMTRDQLAVDAFLSDAPADVVVPRRGDDVVSGRTRAHLQQAVPAWPDLDATASALHLSKSTLQRHLADEGTSFQMLKDELRRDLAILRLTTSNVTLTALSSELGFADSAAFQRAFKSWTGSAPGSYRRERSVNRGT